MKLVCLGDSLTEGYEIDLSKRWTDVLASTSGIEVINSGICGDTTAGMLARFKAMVIDHEPSHVFIMGGTNDVMCGVSNENIKSNLLAMTRYARHHGIQAIIGIPTPYYVELLPEEEQTSNEVALEQSIEMMRDELRLFFMEDGLPIIEFGENLILSDYLLDGCHPNEEGQRKMMEAVNDYISGLI